MLGRIRYPPGVFAAARGLRDDASIVPYRGLFYRRVCGFPVGRGPAVGRRGGIYPSRGRSRRRRVRRDEGIPPYGRFIGSAYTGKAACFRREERHVGADSISARGVCGVAGLPGRDESRPYEQILRFAPPGRPRRFPRFVGEGQGPPAGVRGGAGVAGRCEHRPLQGFVISRRLRFPGPPRARRGS